MLIYFPRNVRSTLGTWLSLRIRHHCGLCLIEACLLVVPSESKPEGLGRHDGKSAGQIIISTGSRQYFRNSPSRGQSFQSVTGRFCRFDFSANFSFCGTYAAPTCSAVVCCANLCSFASRCLAAAQASYFESLHALVRHRKKLFLSVSFRTAIQDDNSASSSLFNGMFASFPFFEKSALRSREIKGVRPVKPL